MLKFPIFIKRGAHEYRHICQNAWVLQHGKYLTFSFFLCCCRADVIEAGATGLTASGGDNADIYVLSVASRADSRGNAPAWGVTWGEHRQQRAGQDKRASVAQTATHHSDSIFAVTQWVSSSQCLPAVNSNQPRGLPPPPALPPVPCLGLKGLMILQN